MRPGNPTNGICVPAFPLDRLSTEGSASHATQANRLHLGAPIDASGAWGACMEFGLSAIGAYEPISRRLCRSGSVAEPTDPMGQTPSAVFLKSS